MELERGRASLRGPDGPPQLPFRWKIRMFSTDGILRAVSVGCLRGAALAPTEFACEGHEQWTGKGVEAQTLANHRRSLPNRQNHRGSE